MQKAAVSVDEVERVTGFDFFSELPDEIENEVESQCNFTLWSRLK
jgi:endonuclease G